MGALAFPNSAVVNSVVASYTNFPHLRIDIEFTVGVNEDIGKVRQVALGVITDDGRFMSDPAPAVVVTVLGDYNITLELRVWLDEERMHIVAETELRERLLEALRAAGVDMPYETDQRAAADERLTRRLPRSRPRLARPTRLRPRTCPTRRRARRHHRRRPAPIPRSGSRGAGEGPGSRFRRGGDRR